MMGNENFELENASQIDNFIPTNDLILHEETNPLNRLINLREAIKLLDALFSKQCQRLRALKERELISEHEFNNFIDYFANKFNHTHEEMVLGMHTKLGVKVSEFDKTILAHPTYDAYYEVMCKAPELIQTNQYEEVTVI